MNTGNSTILNVEVYCVRDCLPEIGRDTVVFANGGAIPEIRAFYTYSDGKRVWRPMSRMVEVPVSDNDQWFYLPSPVKFGKSA